MPYIFPVWNGSASAEKTPLAYSGEEQRYTLKIEYPKAPEKLCLVPGEQPCMVYGMSISNGHGTALPCCSSNGSRRAQGFVFTGGSPYMQFAVEPGEKAFSVSVKICELPDSKTAEAVLALLDDPDTSVSDVMTLVEAVGEASRQMRSLDKLRLHYTTAIDQREDYKRQTEHWKNAYNTISSSEFWRLTYPARRILDLIKYGLKKNRATYLLGKTIISIRRSGLKQTIKKIRARLFKKKSAGELKFRISGSMRRLQSNTVFPRDIKVSVLVPLYNTPIVFLKEMIASVQDQTYANWELCLADGSDEKHSDVGETAARLARSDKRIKYRKLEKNLGISENTNACIEMSTGDHIALFDHDDILHPSALFEVVRAICDKNADMVYTDENTFSKTPEDAYCPHFKPDYSPDTLRSYNYICHLTVFSRKLLEKVGGGFRKEFDGSQDYDMILRLTEKAENIVHIPEILYYWRAHGQSVASDISAKPYTIVAAKKALTEHLDRVGLAGTVTDSAIPSTYRIKYDIKGEPLVSIIIPTKDHISDLKKCLDSIIGRSTYKNLEIVIVENNSTDPETFSYYESLKDEPRIRVVVWKHEFNYSKINNFGAGFCNGEYYILLNNDIEIITPGWIEEMLMFAQRRDVGAVGAMLYYPDDTIQHAGVILGIGGVAGHSHKYFKRGDYGYASRLTIAQDLSCVTAACLMTSRRVWEQVGGLNEKYAVAFNDVDLCMRIRAAGYLIVWTPYAEAYHYESKSRGLEDTPEKQRRFQSEVLRFHEDWDKELSAGDPYYNPNLTLEHEDFSLK